MITIHFPDTPDFKDKKPLPVEVDELPLSQHYG